MPHSINHGDAGFAYFNKIRGIPACNAPYSILALALLSDSSRLIQRKI
jgi:hypothetical protein